VITKKEFYDWLDAEDFYNEEIENGVQFGSDNPWDLVENSDSKGSIRLIDGVLHVSFVDGGWNGYGEEVFSSISEFAERWDDVMSDGLQG